MLPNRLGVVMIYVSDMDRSIQFYRDTLGLPLRFRSPHWTEFAVEGVTLALHGGGTPGEGNGGSDAGTVRIGWAVEDLDGVCAALKERGVRFTMDPKSREGEGIRLAKFVDPDGCELSLSGRLAR